MPILIFFFVGSILSSCLSQVHVHENIRTAKKSFVKIEAYVAACDKEKSSCAHPKLFASGSGAVIRYKNKKAVLTAAHVCYLGKLEEKIKKDGGSVLMKIEDREGRKMDVQVIKYNLYHDVCLLGAEGASLPALRMSVRAPVYGEKVYNISAPMGISEGEMVPIFNGLFMGLAGECAHYSIPTMGGASGSPILNSRGELLGMIHSVHFRFHHMALSIVHKDLWNFIKDHQNDMDIYAKQNKNQAVKQVESKDQKEEEDPATVRFFLKYLDY